MAGLWRVSVTGENVDSGHKNPARGRAVLVRRCS